MEVLTVSDSFSGQTLAMLQQDGSILPVSARDGSSVASSTPLSTELYVDGGNTAPGPRNGSHEHPFLTVQAASDAVTIDNTVIWIAFLPLGYLEDVTIGSFSVVLKGIGNPLQQSPVQLQSIASVGGAVISIENIDVGSITCASTVVELFDCSVGPGLTCQELFDVASYPGLHTLSGAVSVNGAAKLHNIQITSSTFDCVDFVFSADSDPEGENGCAISQINATGNMNVVRGAIALNQSADNMTLDRCSFGQTLTLTCTGSESAAICRVYNSTKPDPASVITFVATVESNDLVLDEFSNQWMNNSVTATFAKVRVIGALATAVLSVTVPAVLAGQVQYANVSTAGTALDGLVTSDTIVGNPTADLVAAGAGGGFINCRVSANDTIRCAFVGPLAGGASNFHFGRLSRSATPF